MRCFSGDNNDQNNLCEFESSLNSRKEKETMYTQNKQTHICLRIRKRKTSIQNENSMYDNLKIKMDIVIGWLILSVFSSLLNLINYYLSNVLINKNLEH